MEQPWRSSDRLHCRFRGVVPGQPGTDRGVLRRQQIRTGFAIGGVPPVGHAAALRTVADSALVELAQLWAAAGTPHAVFPLRGDELARLTGAELAPIATPAPS